VVPGILLAVVLALLDFVWRAWRPHTAVLGRVDGLKGYHDLERYPQARLVPGLVLLRWDAPLFFANAEMFRDRVLEVIETGSETSAPTRWVVVAAEPVTDIDLTAAGMLEELLVELQSKAVTLAMAELKDPVGDRLKRYGLYERIGGDHFFPTIGSAVDGYLDASKVEWIDWEERQAPGTDEPS
jgi:MFS superfamily sulfate permease-like transporter